MKKWSIRDLTDNALIAAAYVVVTLLTISFSFEGIQFRIAEMLIFFCFFNRKYVIGVTLGCLIANFASPLGWPDWVFGTGATLISALLVSISPHLLIAIIFPVVLNGLIVGAELYFVLGLPFVVTSIQVALGELAVLIVGVLIFMALQKNKGFLHVIRAERVLKKEISHEQ